MGSINICSQGMLLSEGALPGWPGGQSGQQEHKLCPCRGAGKWDRSRQVAPQQGFPKAELMHGTS